MSDALRELLASFVVEVDKAGELAKGNAAIEALKERLAELQESFKRVKGPAEQTGKAIGDVFAQAAQTAAKNLKAIAGMSAFGSGRADATGWGDAFKAAADRAAGALPQYGPTRETLQDHQRSEFVADANAHKLTQYGPTRDTLNAGRAQMRAAEEAAAAYAKTLRGKLGGAVNAVRSGFNGGGGGGGGSGPGLIESLATVRNGFLALAGGAVVGGVKRLVDHIGGIEERASKLGVSAAQFQRLGVLAAQSDTSIESLSGAFRNLANAAAQPTKATDTAFALLGLDPKDPNGKLKTTNELFWEVSRALAAVSNETDRSAMAQDLLGRSAQDLKVIFASGADGVDRQREALEKLDVISDKTIAQAANVSDSWAAFGPAILAAAEPLLEVLMPALVKLTELAAEGIKQFGKWLKATNLTATALVALGVAMYWKVIPGLQLMIALGGGATTSLLAIGGAAAKASLSFGLLFAKLYIIQDLLSFFMGRESTIGDLMDKLFGKGASAGVLEALGKAWDMFATAVKSVAETLGIRTPDEKDKAQAARATSAWEGSNFQRMAQRIQEYGMQPGAFTADTGGFGYGGSIPLPGAGTSGGAAPTTVNNISADGDRVVNFTLAPGSDPRTAESLMSRALERDREALLSSMP